MTTLSSPISLSPSTLSVSTKLREIITQELAKTDTTTNTNITLNFRDASYSAEDGGFHPVEIGLQRCSDDQFDILYITDFAYMGTHYSELERELDFDFGNQVAFAITTGWQSIQAPGVDEIYQLWESNFLAYLGMGAFDEIKVTTNV